MSNDFLFGDKTLTFIFMYKYNNIRLIYVNYKSLNNTLKSALVNYFLNSSGTSSQAILKTLSCPSMVGCVPSDKK